MNNPPLNVSITPEQLIEAIDEEQPIIPQIRILATLGIRIEPVEVAND
jgi:hypothetical protein